MFLPISDVTTPRRGFPAVVYLIICGNLAVWYLQLRGGVQFTMAYSAIPFEISHGVDLTHTLVRKIDGERISLVHVAGPHPIQLTLLTSMFMHGSWMHLIGNMLYLHIFGDQIEGELGHFRFLLFYLCCGVVAGLSQIVVDPDSIFPCLGASGAIAGVLGAYLVTHPTNLVKVLVGWAVVYLPAFLVLGAWIALQFFGEAEARTGASSGVAYMAHIGGFAAGVVGVFLLRSSRR